MCAVSAMGDHYQDKWSQPEYDDFFKKFQPVPNTNPFIQNPQPQQDPPARFFQPGPTKAEFDALKKEVEEMKKILERAAEYDKRNNEPHCEMEDKVRILKAVATLVGVDLESVFGKSSLEMKPSKVTYDENGNVYVDGVNFDFSMEISPKSKWQEKVDQMQEALNRKNVPKSGSNV